MRLLKPLMIQYKKDDSDSIYYFRPKGYLLVIIYSKIIKKILDKYMFFFVRSSMKKKLKKMKKVLDLYTLFFVRSVII